jgi:hypothetical protein
MFLLPGVKQIDIRQTNHIQNFPSNDLSFLLWLIVMQMREAKVSFAYIFVHSFLTAALTGKLLWKPH